MWYELLDGREKFVGEVDVTSRPTQGEVIVVDGIYYKWATVLHAFIKINRPTLDSEEKAKHYNKKDKT